MAGNNFFFGQGSDPLLTQSPFNSNNTELQIQELQRMQDEIEQRKQTMLQASQQIAQPHASSASLWGEVEKQLQDMSDEEYDSVINSDEYKQSLNKVMSILQREEMRMMIPHVEKCKDGKEAIEEHLANLKSLRKHINKQKDERLALLNEYAEKYSDMTFADFIKMKKTKKS